VKTRHLGQKNTAHMVFWQNHGIWRKSRFQWFPCFRDFLLTLPMVICHLKTKSTSSYIPATSLQRVYADFGAI